MIDTTDLTSYIPGYDEYCEPKEYKDYDDDNLDDVIDEMLLERAEEKEDEDNGLSKKI